MLEGDSRIRNSNSSMAKPPLPNSGDDSDRSVPGDDRSNSRPNRETFRHLLIGSPKGVKNTIHTLHMVGYAEVGEWSPLLPATNTGEVMAILTRYVLCE